MWSTCRRLRLRRDNLFALERRYSVSPFEKLRKTGSNIAEWAEPISGEREHRINRGDAETCARNELPTCPNDIIFVERTGWPLKNLTERELQLFQYLKSESWNEGHQDTEERIKPEHLVQALTCEDYKNGLVPTNSRLAYIGRHALNAYTIERLRPTQLCGNSLTHVNSSQKFSDDFATTRIEQISDLANNPVIIALVKALNLDGLVRHVISG